MVSNKKVYVAVALKKRKIISKKNKKLQWCGKNRDINKSTDNVFRQLIAVTIFA